jgi:hypothetical protein
MRVQLGHLGPGHRQPIDAPVVPDRQSLEVGFFTPAEIETMPMHESIRLRIRHYLEHRPQPVIA